MRRRQRAEMRLAELTDDEAAMRAGTVPIRRSALRPGGVDGSIPADVQHPSIFADDDAALTNQHRASRISAIRSQHRMPSVLRRR